MMDEYPNSENVSTKNIRMGAAQATTHGVGVQEYLKSLSDLKWLESQDHALEDLVVW